MKPFPLSFAVGARLVVGLILILLAGCSAVPSRPSAVTSPPPPLIGSAPIAAYDEYALVIAPDSGPMGRLGAIAATP